MEIATSLTQYPNQIHTIPLANNETALIRLYYNARMQCWYFDLEYKEITINCIKVTIHPNILRQFRNILPFGICFLSDGYIEPFEIEAFSHGRVSMGILSEEEVTQVESEIYYND
jgi:hypothetical protein